MTAWAFRSAADLAAAIRDRAVGAAELLEYFLHRVDRFNPALNAVVVDDRERARQRARAADAALARGELWGPLHGVPMTVKESYDVAGLVTTHGVPEYAGNVAERDAVAIERLKAAGAVIFGKTNVPLRLADLQTYNAIHGTTSNPYDRARTPGGSSGGSAAALAAGLTALEAGSDIGGSLRTPAHFCGLFAHKPTWGLVPLRGHAPPGILAPSDISVVGPLARAAGDLELALRALAGPDEIDARGLTLDLKPGAEPVAAWKVAVWDDDPAAPVASEIRARVRRAADAFAAAGATVSDSARPDLSPAESHDVYQRLLQPVLSGRLPDADFADLVRRAEALEPDAPGLGARTLRNQTARHRDWLRANEARVRLRWAWHRFFAAWDVLLAPVAAVPAFRHDQRPFRERSVVVDGTERPYFEQVFWAGLAGVALLPATVVPTGLGPDGTPIGVQIMGPAYGDLVTIEAARFLEQEAGFRFAPPPGYED